MESINTQSLNFFNNNCNSYYFDFQESNITTTSNMPSQSNVIQLNQSGRASVSLKGAEALEQLQDKVDKLEAEKESLVNQIYDLRQLLNKVKEQGEGKVHYIKNKNVSLRSQIQALLKSLEISRETSSHFESIYCYWSTNICCCNEDDDCAQDTETTETKSSESLCFTNPSLSTNLSVNSSDAVAFSSMKGKKPIIIMHHQVESEEHQEPEQLLLQPNFKFAKNNCRSRVGRGKGASKSAEESEEEVRALKVSAGADAVKADHQ